MPLTATYGAQESEDVLDAIETRFVRSVVPELEAIGVKVRDLRHLPGTGELHVDLYLPSSERVIRDKVIGAIQGFEASYAHSITVSAALLTNDDAD
jgi:hypothetical protein